MSVHRVGEPDGFTMDIVGPACGCCFYCGEEIQEIAVLWHGHSVSSDPVIALHPACAKNLALHLAKDGVIGDHIARGDTGPMGIHASQARGR